MSQQQEKVQFPTCITETALACTKVALLHSNNADKNRTGT